MSTAAKGNRRLALGLVGIVVAMVGLSFAAVPLYQWICAVTGFGGTTMRADRAPDTPGERMITVRFNADIGGSDLPWRFRPLENSVTLRVGEERLAFYRAENVGREPVVGTATYNVTPHKASIYFKKIACFCFTEQELAAGESLDMPVSFFVDPAIADDPRMRDVGTITLSYTFFRAPNAAPKGPATRTSAAAPAAPAPIN
ncbi:MAG: cytochrome c oxidase assembly protein [Alphaproteobacteria bacterium]|nr:cytochrome c oxidase assembly protein [Alphaproteobacteria bacterium]